MNNQYKLPNKTLKDTIVKVSINQYNQLQVSFNTVQDLQDALGYFMFNRIESFVKDFKIETKSIYMENEISRSRFGYEIHEMFKNLVESK
jgi:hypothetical protein